MVYKNSINKGHVMDLRAVMPLTAARIDRMREQLGKDVVNEMLRKAMAGQPRYFFAAENHRTFGTPDTSTTSWLCWDESDRCYRREPQWMIDAVEFANSIGIEIEIVDMQDWEEARQRAQRLK
jgi:hypothetical protein